MLQIKNSVSIEILADDMIEEIKKAWKSPFDAPVLIFPDLKLEQWFKFRWVEKFGSIANLNTKRLENFLFESLIDKNNDYKPLTSGILRNIIIAYLKKNIDVENENIFSEIRNYLKDDEEEVINEARLFDFSDTLANIYLEYENTRSSDFIKNGDDSGILDSWLKNENYFTEYDFELEKYQKKIYSEIFSEDGCLKDIIAKLNKDESILGSYITLPQLFRKKFIENDIFPNNSDLKLFLFGFSSLSQFYRNAIKYLSLKNTVYLYLANPFADCLNEEIQNDLLANWGTIGKTNLDLWTEGLEECNKKIITLNSNNENNNSDLKLIQKAIIENKESLSIANSNNSSDLDNSIIIQSAPSRLREIEILHSNICKLLKDKKAKIKDIIVASPDLDLYRSAIYQVFNQSAQKEAIAKESRKAVLHIPFSFVDSSDNESLTYLALRRLLYLREKGYLARPDFFDLVRNPVVQAARGIEPDEISDWENWISSMGIYRDKSEEKNWLLGVKRLLLSKLSNKEILDISPFSDIGSSDNDSLSRFIECVDDLEKWICKDNNELKTMTEVDEVFSKIEKWLLMQKVPTGLESENYIFQKIKKSKDELIWQFAEEIDYISYKIFAKTLLNSAMKSKYNSGNLYVNGISFMKFSPNRIIPTKYLLLLGIDSNRFPRKDYVNSLDLREKTEYIAGDVFPSEKDKYALLCYLLNVREALYISYVNKDLQKDEDFYPSSVIIDLCQLLKSKYPNTKDWKELIKPCSNSENRDWKELFTLSALRNKECYEMMIGNGNKEKTPSVSLPLASSSTHSHPEALLNAAILGGSPNSFSNFGGASKNTYPERVNVYQLRSFLEEPFKARVDRIINSEEEDPEKIEFEPIVINNLDGSIIKKQLVLYGLINLTRLDDEQKKENLNVIFDDIIKEINIEFPKDKFGYKVKDSIIEITNNYINYIFSIYNDGYTFKSLELSVDLKNEIKGKTIAWNLNGTANIVAESDSEVHIIELVNSIYSKQYIGPYILSLAYIAENGESKKEVFLDIIPLNLNSNPIQIDLSELEIEEEEEES